MLLSIAMLKKKATLEAALKLRERTGEKSMIASRRVRRESDEEHGRMLVSAFRLSWMSKAAPSPCAR
jgi:hypothetical protein